MYRIAGLKGKNHLLLILTEYDSLCCNYTMKTTFDSSSDSDFNEEKPLPKIPCVTISSDEDSDVNKVCVTQPPND